jgi:hypothetical protein
MARTGVFTVKLAPPSRGSLAHRETADLLTFNGIAVAKSRFAVGGGGRAATNAPAPIVTRYSPTVNVIRPLLSNDEALLR